MLTVTGIHYIHIAVDGAKRMRQIILDLLDASRVGKTEAELETIDLNRLVSEVKLIFRQEIEDKKTKTEIHSLPVVNRYRILLEQLFHNLMGNALKYQREGAAPIIAIRYKDSGTPYQFLVSDKGIGIDF